MRDIEIIATPEPDVPPDLREQIRRLQLQAWPTYRPDEAGPTHDPALRPVSMLLVGDGRVIAALDILSKEIVHGGHRYAASGLSTVVTAEEHRGQGYGRRLVEAAYTAIEKSGVDLGIFTCDTPLRALYERDGWQVLPGTVLVGGTPEAPFPSDQNHFDKVTIAQFLSQRAKLARATFLGARIELYPGLIDRLW